ncbi:MAG: SRPBCC family protein [Pseudorhodobacter sp.]|nr:SRPBCC family protein [Frankiaceae bacterium]
MASLRSTVRIARPADEVWKTVSDAAGISSWFPGIEHATAADGTRSCTLAGGHQLHEDVVNIDHDLRRFQYKITGGMPVEHHLGTVDVLEDGPDGALVVYSTEITPDSLVDLLGPSIEGGVQGLKAHLEGSS